MSNTKTKTMGGGLGMLLSGFGLDPNTLENMAAPHLEKFKGILLSIATEVKARQDQTDAKIEALTSQVVLLHQSVVTTQRAALEKGSFTPEGKSLYDNMPDPETLKELLIHPKL